MERTKLDLKAFACNIRKHALIMTNRGKSSHIGTILSVADILAVLYGRVMRHRSTEPEWPERDRFILSKGHAGAGVYAALAECGYFPVDWLKTHCGQLHGRQIFMGGRTFKKAFKAIPAQRHPGSAAR